MVCRGWYLVPTVVESQQRRLVIIRPHIYLQACDKHLKLVLEILVLFIKFLCKLKSAQIGRISQAMTMYPLLAHLL